MVDAVDPETSRAPPRRARAALADVLARPAHASAHRVVAVGHAHIDSAWLWPMRETVRKVRPHVLQRARADGRPTRDLVFACSSAQQYAWMSDALARALRPDPQAGGARGGSCRSAACGWSRTRTCPAARRWPDSSCRASGSSSTSSASSPTTSGCPTPSATPPRSPRSPPRRARAGSSPRRSPGTRRTGFPHHTFRWEGIDGTRIFTHFPPVDTYNCRAVRRRAGPRRARSSPRRAAATMSLVPFGWGDGGGGPTREMLAAAHRTRVLEGSPTVRMGSPAAFFAAAEAEYPHAAGVGGRAVPGVPPRHLHLAGPHEAGQPAQRAPAAGGRAVGRDRGRARGARLPLRRCWAVWETVLLAAVPRHPPRLVDRVGAPGGRAEYAGVAEDLEAVIVATALAALPGPASGDAWRSTPRRTPGRGAGPGAPRRAEVATRTGDRHDGRGDAVVLDNGLLRVVVDDRGLHRVDPRPAAPTGSWSPPGAAGNLLQLHRDTPTRWDAWDIDAHYRRTVSDLRRGVGRAGRAHADDAWPCGSSAAFGASTDPQTVTLTPARPGSTSTRRSTGTSGRSCSSSPSRWTCTPTGPRRRSSSGTSTARPTSTPRGTQPASRPARIAGCTSASPATASRWPTTRPTATTSVA